MKLLFKLLAVAIFLAPALELWGAPTVAFLPFKNQGKAKWDYFSTVLPTVMASSMKYEYGLKAENPAITQELLKKQGYDRWQPGDVAETMRFARELKRDVVISGTFMPLGRKKVNLKIYCYSARTQRMVILDIQKVIPVEISGVVNELNTLLMSIVAPDMELKCSSKKIKRAIIVHSMDHHHANLVTAAAMKSGIRIMDSHSLHTQSKVRPVTPYSHLVPLVQKLAVVRSVKLYYHNPDAGKLKGNPVVIYKQVAWKGPGTGPDYRRFMSTFRYLFYIGKMKGRGFIRIIDQHKGRIIYMASGFPVSNDRDFHSFLTRTFNQCSGR